MDRRGSLLLLLLLVPIGGCQGSNGAPVKPPPPEVKFQLPVVGNVTDYADFPGSSDAIVTVQVRSRVSGYMTKVYFKDGTMVEEGNLLFEIDPRQYKAELERAEGNLQQIEAHGRRLKKEYERARNLLKKGSVSQEEFDRYESDFKETEANLEIAKANRDLAALNLDWTEVRAPSGGLLSRRMVDPGNLIRADDTVLTSIVTQDPMYVYFDVDEQNMLKVRHLLRDGKIKAKSEKEVPVLFGLSDESPNFPHTGTVDFTDNRVDINTGSLRFRAAVRNEKGILTPGLFVRVRLPIGDPHPTLFVPEEALASDQGRKIVYTVEWKPVDADVKPVTEAKSGHDEAKPSHDEKAKEPKMGWVVAVKPLKIGSLRDGFRAVEEGLAPTDKVIVTGLQRVRPGKEVKPVEKPVVQQPPHDISFQFPTDHPDKPGGGSPDRGDFARRPVSLDPSAEPLLTATWPAIAILDLSSVPRLGVCFGNDGIRFTLKDVGRVGAGDAKTPTLIVKSMANPPAARRCSNSPKPVCSRVNTIASWQRWMSSRRAFPRALTTSSATIRRRTFANRSWRSLIPCATR